MDLGLIGERSCRIRLPASSKSWWWATASRTLPYSSEVPAVSNFSSSSPVSTIDWSRLSVPTVFAITVSYGRCHDSPPPPPPPRPPPPPPPAPPPPPPPPPP